MTEGDQRPTTGETPPGRWRAPAFGLDLECGFEVPGLSGPGSAEGSGTTTVELVADEAIADDWRPEEAERIALARGPGGEAEAQIHADPARGFLFTTLHFGRFRVSRTGSRVACAPSELPPWRWQRYLLGQVLPFAAVVRGVEVFHASAVVLPDGTAAAFAGGSQAGKSTTAAGLSLRGAQFLTDDVLAVVPSGDGILAQPGPGIAKLRAPALDLMPEEERVVLGPWLGHGEGSEHFLVDRHPRPARLGALYFLWDGPGLGVEEMSELDPRLLLASSFNFALRSPERLTGQLDVCARISRAVPAFRLVAPDGVSAAQLAGAVEAHAGAVRR